MESSNMWAQTAEMAKRHDNGGQWLRLQNDGDKTKVVFLGEPYPREVCFVDNKYLLASDSLRAEGHRVSLRIAFAVALLDTREVKVFEQGVGFFKDLLEVKEKYGLERWAFQIKRIGAAKDPKTKYSILPERQLSPDEVAAFKGFRIPNLRDLYSDVPSASGAAAAAGTSNATPHSAATSGGAMQSGFAGAPTFIDPHTGQQLVSALKMLPRESIDRFLAHFGVQQIKLVPAARTEEARYFVEALAAEFAARQQAAAPQEIDPFA
jgi:hypothetical protein